MALSGAVLLCSCWIGNSRIAYMQNEYGIKQYLWDFAAKTVALYNMDESHGMQHFVCTALYADLILSTMSHLEIAAAVPGASPGAAAEIIVDAAFVHDLIDAKYAPHTGDAWVRLARCLVANGRSVFAIEAIGAIIKGVSWSERHRRLTMGQPMIEPGLYSIAIGIVADADQLDGYNVDRCKKYQAERLHRAGVRQPQYERLCRRWVKTVLVNRVLRYRDHYFSTDAARRLARPLHIHVAMYVENELADVDMIEGYP